MASSIRVFQFIQKFQRFFGIYQPQPHQEEYSLNFKNKIFLIAFAPYGLTVIAFLVFEANSIFDFAFAFIALVSIAYSILTYLLFIWQAENTVQFIENCEKFIEKSTYRNYRILTQ